jgi:hypothetical protein
MNFKDIKKLSEFYKKLPLTQKESQAFLHILRNGGLVLSSLEFKGLMLSVDGRKPIKCQTYAGTPLDVVEEAVLQYIFGTRNKHETIVKKLLQSFPEKIKDKIRIWIPSLHERKFLPKTTAQLVFTGGFVFPWFNISLQHNPSSKKAVPTWMRLADPPEIKDY